MNEKAPEWLEAYAIARDEIWEKDPHFKGFLAALQELNKETDRGVALVATSFLGKLLMDTLAAFLIENASAKALLSGFNAPFGSLSTRIAGCLAMGLITAPEAQQCDTLRKVRNRFAHEVEMNFSARQREGALQQSLGARARQRWRRPKEIHVGSDDNSYCSAQPSSRSRQAEADAGRVEIVAGIGVKG